jgi:serine/threonine protein phosphatase 1
MLKSLFRKAPAFVPLVPDDVRLYAIGDVHGRADLLQDLLAAIEEDDAGRPPKRRQLILLGDLIDRGADSRGVVEAAMGLQDRQQARVLAGNHEELLLLAYDGDIEAAKVFSRAGGRETMLSYGVSQRDYDGADFDGLIDLLRAHVPAEHVAFLRALEDVIEIGGYAFVHAGIKPGVPLAAQDTRHLRWIRREFLDSREQHTRFIVHGHTITEEVDERHNRIGIDTGAYASGRLTALGIDGDRRWIIQTGASSGR